MEFSILAVVFFLLVFGTIELARLVYVLNTVHEVTRYAANAAALNSHRDMDAPDRMRQRTVLRNSSGNLLLGAPVSDSNVRIDYLALPRDSNGNLSQQPMPSSSLPICPRKKREICIANPNGSNCIRFARASICADDGTAQCDAVAHQSYLPLAAPVPEAVTIRVLESFGSMP